MARFSTGAVVRRPLSAFIFIVFSTLAEPGQQYFRIAARAFAQFRYTSAADTGARRRRIPDGRLPILHGAPCDRLTASIVRTRQYSPPNLAPKSEYRHFPPVAVSYQRGARRVLRAVSGAIAKSLGRCVRRLSACSACAALSRSARVSMHVDIVGSPRFADFTCNVEVLRYPAAIPSQDRLVPRPLVHYLQH